LLHTGGSSTVADFIRRPSPRDFQEFATHTPSNMQWQTTVAAKSDDKDGEELRSHRSEPLDPDWRFLEPKTEP